MIGAILTFLTTALFADPAAEVKLFTRCYSQITGVSAPRQQMLDIRGGKTKAMAACLAALDSAKLDGDGSLTQDTPLGRQVLANLNRVHGSFFANRELPSDFGRFGALVSESYDPMTTAFYFTRALFGKDFRFDSIYRGAVPMALRTNQAPTIGVAYKYDGKDVAVDDTIFASTPYAPNGDLLGILPRDTRDIDYSFGTTNGRLRFGQSFGPGVTGSFVYLYKSDPALNTRRPDGGVGMPRKWARDLFLDAMCRELPLLRTTDVQKYVDATSPVPFRGAAGCVSCHASMDQAASVIRHLKIASLGSTRVPDLGIMHIVASGADLPAVAGWPAKPDANFNRRPPNGRLLYRDYRGALVDVPVEGMTGLMTEMLKRKDVYVCTAKRYYEYFTGWSVDVSDPEGKTFDKVALEHRNRVIRLGEQLFEHQSIRKLIETILTEVKE
jgi:hypothetical protein